MTNILGKLKSTVILSVLAKRILVLLLDPGFEIRDG
jgi:hypothetical protein